MDFFILVRDILAIFNFICAIFIVFFEKKNPSTIWAWLMILALIPYFGFIIYFILGFEGRKHIIFAKKQQKDSATFIKFIKNNPHLINRQYNQLSLNNILPIPHTQHLNDVVTMNLVTGGSLYSTNNSIKIYHEGTQKFADLLSDIKNAKSFIHMEYYLVHDDKLGKKLMYALAEKAKQGLEVKLYYDGTGNITNSPSFSRILTKAGGEVKLFLPPKGIRINYRNHRKIAVIDGKIGYVGGLNIGDEYISDKKRFGYWRDSHIRIIGEAVSNLELRFIMDWNFSKGTPLSITEKYFPKPEAQPEEIHMQIVSSGPDCKWDNIYYGYFKMITEANKSIYIATPYFVPDTALLEALKTAALAGVDVRIIIPARPDHLFVYWSSLSYMGELLEAGVRCYQYEKGFIHSKVMTMDGIITSIGTANMDIRSFKLNFEINAFIYNEKITKDFNTQFKIDFDDCKEITQELYDRRGPITKIKEAFARLISPLL